MTALLAGALAIAIGWLAVRIARPAFGLAPRWASLVFEIALGAGAGVAITSLLFLSLVAMGAASRWVVLAAELAVLASLSSIVWLRRSPAPEPAAPAGPGFRWNWLLAIAVVVGLILIVAMQVNTARVSPFGNWDAFGKWNLDAKLLLSGSLSNNAALLSSFVARSWLLSGNIGSPAAPMTTALFFAAAAIALVFAAIALTRGLASALLACLVLFSATSYIEQISWQYAGIPGGFYILAALASALLSGRRGRIMAGAFALCAAWMLIPTHILPAGQGGRGTVALLVSGAVSWGEGLGHPLVLLAILAIALRFEIDPKHRRVLWFGAGSLAALLIVSAGVYLLREGEPPWLEGIRARGIYAQLWPSAVLLAFLALGRPQDPPIEEAHAKKPVSVKRKRTR